MFFKKNKRKQFGIYEFGKSFIAVLQDLPLKKVVRDSYQGVINGFRDPIGNNLRAAVANFRAKDLTQAHLRLKYVLARKPDDADANFWMARVKYEQGDKQTAEDFLQKSLKQQPDFDAANFFQDFYFERKSPRQYRAMPSLFVKQKYQELAPEYNQYMVDNTSLQTHFEIEKYIVQKGLQNDSGLDLGCGTGLVGDVLSGQLLSLTGVDVSHDMIQRVNKQKKNYQNLIRQDLNEFLAYNTLSYDIIFAVYLLVDSGDISELLEMVKLTLKKGGVFIFNHIDYQEIQEGYMYDVKRQQFLHSVTYVEKQLEKAGIIVQKRIQIEVAQGIKETLYITQIK